MAGRESTEIEISQTVCFDFFHKAILKANSLWVPVGPKLEFRVFDSDLLPQ